MRLELHTILHLRLRIPEISDEVEGFIVGRGVPELPLHLILDVFEDKLGGEGGLGGYLGVLFQKEILQDLAVFLTDHHGWDADTRASAIITHNNVLDISGVTIIDDDSEWSSCFLYISHFSHEVAITPVNQENRCQDAIWVPREILSEIRTSTPVRIGAIVIYSTYLQAKY